ncbi:hypothetical protein Strvi_9367 (plasmid) [Streptomyces violaceusniger Tu 4113]|uniref:Uncharacterized protein n=1 Tax=Streptomyces violaceusniger (strain Tu 4113) TaxID=653045 RepID=G2PH56_STRV4|nr:hypothetical protein Strvi_9367 [Streptomyces violaceusniger Tu 4113]
MRELLKALGHPSRGVRPTLKERWLFEGTLPFMTVLNDALGSADNLLGTFPLHPTEIRIGYAR